MQNGQMTVPASLTGAFKRRFPSLRTWSVGMDSKVEHLHSQARSLAARFDQRGRTTRWYIDKAIVLDRDALILCPPGHHMRSSSLACLSTHLSIRYARFGAITDVEEVIVLDREVLGLRPQGHPDRPISLNSLAGDLSSRYDRLGTISDLEEAIGLAREALELCPQGHPSRSPSLNNLAARLSTRYNRSGAPSDLDEAIVLAQEALALRPQGHPHRSISLNSLAARLSTRYNRFGAPSDLDEAIVLAQEALALRPQGHSHRSISLNNLAARLSTRYNRFGALSDLDKAVALAREALELRPQGHPDRSMSLNNLAVDLSSRYRKLGSISDLDSAIVLCREALALCPHSHPHRSIPLNNLAARLSARYNRLGSLTDLDEAILLAREALALRQKGHPHRASSLISLAARLSSRYNRFGTLGDVDEAILLAREALELCSRGHPRRSSSLNILASHLSTRYNRLGGISDLNEAIGLAREALELCPQGNPDRQKSLNNLTGRLSTRYDQLGAIQDLNEAIDLAREAFGLCPQGHPDRSTSLESLANSLSIRCGQLGSGVQDLDEAIALAQEALELRPPGHPLRSTSLDDLGIYLSTRYKRLSNIQDLEEAIALAEQALELRPPGHPGLSTSLDKLGIYLSSRYERFGEFQDLNKSIVLAREALELRPRGHPLRSSSLNNLASVLFTRCKQCASHQDLGTSSPGHHPPTSLDDLDEAFSLYIQLVDVSHAVSTHDLAASQAWIQAAENFQHPSTLRAYETSLRLLDQHLSLFSSISRDSQHLDMLKNCNLSLAADAFSACLRNGALTRAVELLEQGRGVFWNKLTPLYSPLDDVIAIGQAGEVLANEFTHLSSLIRRTFGSPSINQHRQLRALDLEMQRVVAAIRQLPGLSHFVLPPLFTDLQRAASGGPVIIVNASQYGCDALVIFDDRDPVHVPLLIDKKYVRHLSSKLRTFAKRSSEVKVLAAILRELWDDVVFPVVCLLLTICPLQSRIWWCPTAEFSDLPFHAAAPYRTGQQKLADLYISSYTPTLSVLICAKRAHLSRPASDPKRVIAIGQANAAGQRELLSVDSELAMIGEGVRGVATFRQIDDKESCIERVSEELGKNTWVHFACHGIANREDPFKSAFVLYDGHFTINHIIGCHSEDPEFAYLSACHTTVGNEMIHLASALQSIGFRSVIGTMWAVDDGETNKITSVFYRHMLDESGHLDHTRAAFALNTTMKLVNLPLDQRALYIHLGA